MSTPENGLVRSAAATYGRGMDVQPLDIFDDFGPESFDDAFLDGSPDVVPAHPAA